MPQRKRSSALMQTYVPFSHWLSWLQVRPPEWTLPSAGVVPATFAAPASSVEDEETSALIACCLRRGSETFTGREGAGGEEWTAKAAGATKEEGATTNGKFILPPVFSFIFFVGAGTDKSSESSSGFMPVVSSAIGLRRTFVKNKTRKHYLLC